MPEDTPMFKQYSEVKAKLAPNTLLLFRLGDFFEMFDEDAQIASNILGLTLTHRHGRPMAGLPFHALNSYMRRLLGAGRRVAVCDQLEEARPGKLVKRELVRVYSAGTVIADEHLNPTHNQYLLSLHQVGGKRPTPSPSLTNKGGENNIGLRPITPSEPQGKQVVYAASWMELSTGEWAAAADVKREDFLTFLTLLQPTELIVPEEGLEPGLKETLIENLPGLAVSELPTSFFEPTGARKILCEALNVATLKGFGLSDEHPAIGAAGALYCYAKQALCSNPQNLNELRLHTFENRLMIDPNTARQLELFKDLSGGREGTLLKAIDSTVTSAGARLLERVMLSPSCDLSTLGGRYEAVGALKADAEALKDLRENLSCLRDLERILSRLQNRMRSPRELAATRDTLRMLPDLKRKLETFAGTPTPCPLPQGTREGNNKQGLASQTLSSKMVSLPNPLSNGLASPARDSDSKQAAEISDPATSQPLSSGTLVEDPELRAKQAVEWVEDHEQANRQVSSRRASINTETLQNFSSPLTQLTQSISLHDDLKKKLGAALDEEPSNDLTTGGYIRPGYDAELDRLKSLSANHKVWVAELERQEQERSGIKSLKVKYNQNFGFFIEITKANLARVPADYIRRSTTVGGERYVTAALQERQKEIFSAESNALNREMELFNALVNDVIAEADALRRTAQALAWADLLAAFALNALKWSYCAPQVDAGTRLEIVGGRHPVVEQSLLGAANASERFVPNDTRMSAEAEQILLITGPNMAGKSTYIRQVALIVLMAQMGSWVPASSAQIGLVDRIFSRIGSSDALARGESTFMVEMTETAYILRAATEKSLLILDEIGRGTSTYDGLSIAWACVEYLHSSPSMGPRTLFATHYHELTRLEKTLPRLRNYTVSVKEWGGKIIFVRQVVPGTADKSYGIHVAQLAGLPPAIIDRATKLLESLEAQAKAPKQKADKVAAGQGELFG